MDAPLLITWASWWLLRWKAAERRIGEISSSDKDYDLMITENTYNDDVWNWAAIRRKMQYYIQFSSVYFHETLSYNQSRSFLFNKECWSKFRFKGLRPTVLPLRNTYASVLVKQPKRVFLCVMVYDTVWISRRQLLPVAFRMGSTPHGYQARALILPQLVHAQKCRRRRWRCHQTSRFSLARARDFPLCHWYSAGRQITCHCNNTISSDVVGFNNYFNSADLIQERNY